MYCQNCGNEVKDEDKFCQQCGSSLLKEQNMIKKPKSSLKITFITILVMLCFCGVVFLFQTGRRSGKLLSEIASEDVKRNYLAWAENREGTIGFISKEGKEVIPCKYDYADDFKNGFALVAIENGMDEEGTTVYLYGLVNTSGEEIIPCEYDGVYILEESGLIVVEQNKKAWLKDENGNDIISSKYDGIWQELGKTGLICVELDGKKGAIDNQGNEIIPKTYDNIFNIENKDNRDLICVQKGKISAEESVSWGIVNKQGNEIVPLQGAYPGIRNSSGLIKVEQGGKSGFVDYSGSSIIPEIYDWASDYGDNGLAVVNKDGDTFILDKTGAIKSACLNTYDYAYPFDHCCLAVVYISDEGYGAINENGEEIIPCTYDSILKNYSALGEYGCFDENNLAAVSNDDKWGVIDNSGREIVPIQYDHIQIFDNGIIRADKGGVYGAMNKNGDIILPFEYDWIYAIDKDVVSTGQYEFQNFGSNITARKNEKSSLFDKNGNEIFSCIYNSFIAADERGYFVAYLEDNEKSPVLLTISGEEIVPEGYDYIGSFGDDDLVAVAKDGFSGYLDREGKVKMQIDDKYVKSGEFVQIYPDSENATKLQNEK